MEKTEPELWQMSDLDFLYYLALDRSAYSWETERRIGLDEFRASLLGNAEFRYRNPLTADSAEPGLDADFPRSADLVARAYRVAQRRVATDEELAAWMARPRISRLDLARQLFYAPEAAIRIGARHHWAGDAEAELDATQFLVNIVNQDLYSASLTRRRGRDVALARKRQRLLRPAIRIGLKLFEINDADLARVRLNVAARFADRQLDFVRLSPEEDFADNRHGLDLLIANNNFLYTDPARIFGNIKSAEFVSACWQWDNHHQFKFTTEIADAFDIIFPAHSNGQSYLHGRTAVVGTVVPCCAIQWSYDEARQFFEQCCNDPRDDALYGRFNSYTGRISERDVFLRIAMEQVPENCLKLFDVRANDWYALSLLERFKDGLQHKFALCNPIYNDLPARVFDTLLFGSIPIVPHGLPDLERCFSGLDLTRLPIITYIPESIASLRHAVDRARQAFDRGGLDGARDRHLVALNRHLLANRLADVIADSLTLAEIAQPQR